MATPPQPIPFTAQTALLLIDNQIGFKHRTYWGNSRSTPSYESNLASLLTAFRSDKDKDKATTTKPLIIHIQHLSKSPSSPLHEEYVGEEGSGFEGQHGVDFLPFARPRDGEDVLTKNVNSAFIGTDLERLLRSKKITTLVIAGVTTDHCVSTTTRMAANLGVVDYDAVKGRIILVDDATTTWAKGGFEAEVVQKVSLASLANEFAEIRSTAEVLKLLK